PGLGKSRLAHEFAGAAAAEGWMVLEGRASPYDRSTTYFPIRSLLRAWLKMSPRDSQAEVAEKLRNGIATVEASLLERFPALRSLLDLPSDTAWQGLEPAQHNRSDQDAAAAARKSWSAAGAGRGFALERWGDPGGSRQRCRCADHDAVAADRHPPAGVPSWL